VPDKQSGSSVCDVADPSLEPVVLPVGFEKFNRRGFLNYQFNRAHGLGWAGGHELRDAAARRFVMVMPAGNAAHIEARVAFGLGSPATRSVLWPRPRRDTGSSIGCLPVRITPRHGLPRRS
jgi:hypothetical protein